MKSFLSVTLLGTAQSSLMSFDSFVERYSRSYQKGSSEHGMRRALYEARLNASEAHNSQAHRLWTAGVNEFWDWSEGETMSLRGWDGSAKPAGHGVVRKHAFLQRDIISDDSSLPDEKIWSGLSAERHTRNQGNCGSCWAIASATVLEAHAEISGNPRTFSAQQIVECTPNPRHCGGDGGCDGATAELAMDYVMKNGLPTEEVVPYTGGNGACPRAEAGAVMAQLFGSSAAVVGMTGWQTLPKNEYAPLAHALAERGPVAVSVAADAWFNYNSGIFNGCAQDAVVDHSVTAIGYGAEAGRKYWVIQNSWGTEWGEGGNIRLERHPDGQYCGMNNDPQKGIACKGETDPVPVCGMCGILFDSVVPHFR